MDNSKWKKCREINQPNCKDQIYNQPLKIYVFWFFLCIIMLFILCPLGKKNKNNNHSSGNSPAATTNTLWCARMATWKGRLICWFLNEFLKNDRLAVSAEEEAGRGKAHICFKILSCYVMVWECCVLACMFERSSDEYPFKTFDLCTCTSDNIYEICMKHLLPVAETSVASLTKPCSNKNAMPVKMNRNMTFH